MIPCCTDIILHAYYFYQSSMSGHRLISTQPNTFFYGATKFAATALTEGIRQELREMKSNVKVTVS